MAVDLSMAKRFAGIPEETADAVFEGCVAAAEAWYAAAGVSTQLAGDPLYDFWVANLAAWMYDNRGDAESSRQVPTYIVTSVHALRHRALSGASRQLSQGESQGSDAADAQQGAQDAADAQQGSQDAASEQQGSQDAASEQQGAQDAGSDDGAGGGAG